MTNFGWRDDLEERQLLAATSQLPLYKQAITADAPPEIDPRAWHRIEMQGALGSCQGHALSSVGEMAHWIAAGGVNSGGGNGVGGRVTQFSPLFAYYATQQLDGLLGADQGSTIHGGVRCAREFGFCPLEVFPNPRPLRYTGQIPDEAWPAAAPFRMRSHTVCTSYDDVWTFLAAGQGGVSAGLGWNASMTPRAGLIEGYRPGGGGHAVAFLGYSRRVDAEGRHYLWLANSWSEDWGNRGWAEVAPRAIDAMFADRRTVMVGLSDLSLPTPRRVPWREDSVFG